MIIDEMKEQLTQEEWDSLLIVHKLTNRLNIAINFQFTKSIDVRSESDSMIVDESILTEHSSNKT